MKVFTVILGAAVIAAIAAPRRAAAQQTETAVEVGTSQVGVGPNGATLRCRDGFYPAPGAPDAACQARGGVLARFPLRRTPSRAAAAPRSTPANAPTNAQANAQANAARAAQARESARRARADSLNRAASTPPAGATLLCTDGTWIVRDTTQSRCGRHGGVRIILPRTH